jgi:hypothetical protein
MTTISAGTTAARREAAGIRERYDLYIGGEWVPAAARGTVASIDPATEGW